MATIESHEANGRSPISDLIEALFQNDGVISMLLKSLLGANIKSDDPRGKTPEEIANFEREFQILRKQPLLTEAIFNGGVRDLIAIGRTTITELDGKPKELLDSLRNGRIRGAVADGVITIKQLSGISPDKLKEIDRW